MKTNVTEITVTLDGKPLAGANVALVPKDPSGVAAFGITGGDGKCKTQTLFGRAGGGTAVGQYSVTVSKMEERPTGRKAANPDTGVMGDVTENVETLPEKYLNASSTPFQVEVKSGKNAFPVELSSAR